MTSTPQPPHSLHYVRPVTVAFVRKTGLVADAAQDAWGELRSLSGREFAASGTGFGLLHRDAGNGGHVSFDACADVSDAVPDAMRTLPTQIIAGGVHISAAPVTSHQSLEAALKALLGDPLIGHGLSIDLDRPALIYYERAKPVGGRERWTLALNVPLRWSTYQSGQAA